MAQTDHQRGEPGELAANMIGAWSSRAADALRTLQFARQAPTLFKPETVEKARADYAKALSEVARWSS